MKNEKNVPFPAPYCIFLRTYLLTMFCGKRKNRHFPDLQFKNIPGNMGPDSLFWSAFRALAFLPVRTPSKSLAMPLHAPKSIFWRWSKGPKDSVQFIVNLTFQSHWCVALKKRVKIEHLGYFVWNIEPQVSRFKTRFIQLPVYTGAPNDCFL